VASITLKEVNKSYPNGHEAVRDMTLDIRDGELLVLVGPSGSGKSTVLRLIAGLDMPTTGQIFIDGRDATRVTPQARDLAMVFQSYALYPHKSVRENLAFGLRVRHIDAANIEARVRTAAATLGIEDLLERKAAQLSGGQRQRVALGRAIVREPKAFLLDEPLSNLDPQLRVDTRAELALLHRQLAATMVYVTHDQEEAMTLGTRVAVMRSGILEQIGPPLEIFHRPANAFVAGFVGSPAMNIWPCTYRRLDGGTVTTWPGRSIRMTALGLDLPDGSEVLLGARPHDIDLTAGGDADGHGRIEVVEPLGPVTVLHLRVEDLPKTRVRVVVPADAPLGIDKHAGFRVRHDRVHVFDSRTGRRLN
jgi:multiple sugar transport system ATP-binding protein